jgi:2-(1,2-epoxy-1,2-dihydrophenyl)acetyl-CoA isomerase
MNVEEILFERRPGVSIVTFNRPESRNAITPNMTRLFQAHLEEIEHDSSVRCVLVQGAGEHFMAGGDVKSFAETLALAPEARRELFAARVRAVAPLLKAIERVPQVVITAVKGACAGAAVGFVAASDLTIATRSSFYLLAQVHIGVSPDGSTSYWLPRAVGLKRAKEIALLGGRFSAEDGERWGLINRVVDDVDFDAAVTKLVNQVAAGPAKAMGETKALFNKSLNRSIEEQLEAEALAFSACTTVPDFDEGLNAFIGKRKPRFDS